MPEQTRRKSLYLIPLIGLVGVIAISFLLLFTGIFAISIVGPDEPENNSPTESPVVVKTQETPPEELPDDPPIVEPKPEPEEPKALKGSTKDIPYGEHSKQELDIYAPDAPENAPVMFYVHGGAWMAGSKSFVGEKTDFFTTRGWIFVSSNYRLSPSVKHPEHVRDIAKAIAWTLDHIKEWGGDPSQLYLMGHSAGCHLVSLVATDERRLGEWGKKLSDIKGVIANDVAMYDVPTAMQRESYRRTLRPVFGSKREDWKDASPFEFVKEGKDIPPFLIAYSKGMGFAVDDFWKDASEAFAKKLRDAGIEATLFDGQDRSHAAINWNVGKFDDDLTALIWKSLKRWRGE